MKFIWIEILKFFKNNIYKIILGTVAITSLFLVNSYLNESSKVDETQDESEISTEARTANFYFYVEYADNSAFTNYLLIEEYLLTESLMEEASKEIGIDINALITNTENSIKLTNGPVKTSKVIGTMRNSDMNLLELYVNVGDEGQNLKLTNFYYDLLINKNIPFLEDKGVYIFEEPNFIELEESTESFSFERNDSGNILRTIVIGIIVGSIISTAILLLLTLISQKLNYSFSYFINRDDIFYLIDNKIPFNEELKFLLQFNSNSNTIIVCQDTDKLLENSSGKMINKMISNSKVKVRNNIYEVEDFNHIDRIIFIIQEDVTTRKWYDRQRNIEKILKIPTVVLQINKI